MNDAGLLGATGLSERLFKRCVFPASPTQLEFENILSDAAEIREAKVRVYGESAYNNDDPVADMWERFFDVKRKFQRLETLTKLTAEGDSLAIPPLIDAYRDILNYAAMGVQVLEKHYGKIPLDKS